MGQHVAMDGVASTLQLADKLEKKWKKRRPSDLRITGGRRHRTGPVGYKKYKKVIGNTESNVACIFSTHSNAREVRYHKWYYFIHMHLSLLMVTEVQVIRWQTHQRPQLSQSRKVRTKDSNHGVRTRQQLHIPCYMTKDNLIV